MDEVIANNIDNLIDRINHNKFEPFFSIEITRRKEKVVPSVIDEKQLLILFTQLIAFSQQANSKLVQEILDRDVFRTVLKGYNLDEVKKMNPCDIVDQHWPTISCIRQQSKLFQIVMFARALKKNPEVLSLLMKPEIPLTIELNADVRLFWSGFDKLKRNLIKYKVPFLRETTTLLHFLMELGYDCIKPDSVVMKVAKKLCIVDDLTGDKNLRLAVNFLQQYSLSRNIRPPLVDLYFLIEGKQRGAEHFVVKEYYK